MRCKLVSVGTAFDLSAIFYKIYFSQQMNIFYIVNTFGKGYSFRFLLRYKTFG